MKILNLKFGLFSLLAIFSVSIFLTSCAKEEAIEQAPNTEQVMENFSQAEVIVEPYGISDLSESEKRQFLLNMIEDYSSEELAEHTKIFNFLSSVNKLEKVEANMKVGEIYTKALAVESLKQIEVNKLVEFLASEDAIEMRWTCSGWYLDCVLKTAGNRGQCQYRAFYRNVCRHDGSNRTYVYLWESPLRSTSCDWVNRNAC